MFKKKCFFFPVTHEVKEQGQYGGTLLQVAILSQSVKQEPVRLIFFFF